jgi:hypothetical protein
MSLVGDGMDDPPATMAYRDASKVHVNQEWECEYRLAAPGADVVDVTTALPRRASADARNTVRVYGLLMR